MRENVIAVEEFPTEPQCGATYSVASNNITTATHGFFKYPCKFIPHVPRWAIRRYLQQPKDGLLDPFCGSGTTLVEGVLRGKTCYGVEIDPLGRLLTEVKTAKFSEKELLGISETRRRLIRNLENRSSCVWIPYIPNMRLWFSEQACWELGRIRWEIDDSTEPETLIRKFFYVCLANIIRRVSNADDQSPKPYVSRNIKKNGRQAIPAFAESSAKLLSRVTEFSFNRNLGRCLIVGKDALTLAKEQIPGSVTLAVTSPPYINAFDYVRSLKLENLWLGLVGANELQELRKRHVGSEYVKVTDAMPSHQLEILDKTLEKIFSVDKKRACVVSEFFKAMENNLKRVFDVLQPGGAYCIAIGDSNIRGTIVATHDILMNLGRRQHFMPDLVFSYEIKNRYLRFPRQGRGGLIEKDWVVVLVKP